MTKNAKKSTPVRVDEAALIKKYKHIVPGSLKFSKVNNKQQVTINTFGINGKPDGNTRVIFTSDLFHVRHTKEVAKEVRLAKIRANRQAKAAARPAKVKAVKPAKVAKVKAVKPAKAAKKTAADAAPAVAATAAAATTAPVTTTTDTAATATA